MEHFAIITTLKGGGGCMKFEVEHISKDHRIQFICHLIEVFMLRDLDRIYFNCKYMKEWMGKS